MSGDCQPKLPLEDINSWNGKSMEPSVHLKNLHYTRFVDEFPTTVTGKLQKFRMREIALQKLQAAV